MKSHLAQLFTQALNEIAPEATDIPIELARPKQEQHGDFACNLALQLAKRLRRITQTPPMGAARPWAAAG